MSAWLVASLRPIAALVVIAMVAAPLPRWLAAAVGAALGLFVAAAVPGTSIATLDATMIARELVVGATIGVLAALPLIAFGWAARLVDVAAGEPGARTIFVVLGAAVFVGLDGPAVLAATIVRSYADIPIAGSGPGVVAAIGALAAAAARLAIPFVVGAAVIEIAVGAVARAAASPRLVTVLPWRRSAVIGLVAAGLVLIAVGLADAIRAAWIGA